MQPMRLCLFSCRPFEETFENAQWRKVKNKQYDFAFSGAGLLRRHLKMTSCAQFEDTFENAHK